MVSNLYNNHSASNEETSSCIDNYACIDNYEATHIVEFKFAIHLQSQLKILPCIIHDFMITKKQPIFPFLTRNFHVETCDILSWKSSETLSCLHRSW